MIWAIVSSRSCFCWLFRASPSLAGKNVINLISLLTILWCPCVDFLLCCWKRVLAMTSVFSWQNSVSLCSASLCAPRPKLPAIPGISWLPTSVLDYWKNGSFDYMDLCWQSDVSAFNMLSRFVIVFLPSSKHLLNSWLQSPSRVILGLRKIKFCHCFHFFPFYLPWSDETRCHDLSF